MMSLLRDRGTIKWTAMMLPEHVQHLKALWKEDEKIDCPDLDNQALEELNERCVEAYNNQTHVSVAIFKNGFVETYQGVVSKLRPMEAKIEMQILQGQLSYKRSFPVHYILSIEEK